MLDGEQRAERLKIAVVGAGISGLAAAWLLSQRHDVTLYEKDTRLGGHSNTAVVPTADGDIPVDTGFIVYNPKNYPNLTALFAHFDVETAPSDMSFGVSLDGGRFEYGGSTLASLIAQKRNILRPRYWAMLRDLIRFYREVPSALSHLDASGETLGQYLKAKKYSAPFLNDHLLPMAGAIWSAAPDVLRDYPAAAFIRFFRNHGLLELRDRPPWRTVTGGSINYVRKLAETLGGAARIGVGVKTIRREAGHVVVVDSSGQTERFDQILISAHADQALVMLADPSDAEHQLLGAFQYTSNIAVLHCDDRLMPKRRRVWSSWNYIGDGTQDSNGVCVTYWMNKLQPLNTAQNIYITLNPRRAPRAGTVMRTELYQHPVFTSDTLRAQAGLSLLQGDRSTWFCGAYFGSGFHEDGLKSGLAAAEAMGGVKRPWSFAQEATSEVNAW